MKVRINEAQRVLIQCGVDHQVVLLGHVRDRSRSHTKKGPGRVHQNGKPKEVQS